MLRKIEIDNFKCIDSLDIELKNFNLLAGINSAGKSTIIQALLLLFQASEISPSKREKITAFNGNYVTLGEVNDVKNIYTGKHEVSLLVSDGVQDYYMKKNKEDIFNYSENISDLHERDLVYLCADRVGVKDVYTKNLQGDMRIGVHGEYSFAYLSEHKSLPIEETEFVKDESVGMGFGNQVNYWLDYIVGYRVSAEDIDKTNVVKVIYSNAESTRELRPCHVGTGVSYIANLIVAALSCRQGSLFIVENPEIHLHAGAQSRTIEFLLFMASRGLQVIVETHSDHIFNGVRKELKNKKITPELMQVLFVQKNKENVCEVRKVNINEAGIIENHQKGLFDQFDEDLDELLGLNDYE